MRALVTGGAGFIGSNLVDALLAGGAESVDVIDDLSTGREGNLSAALERGATLHRLDIRDATAVGDAFAQARPDVVFHLAAQIDVRKSVAAPAFDAAVNVVGTVNVLEAARGAGVRRFVNTSTGGAIYGEADVVPTPEDTAPRPLAAYGQSKFCAERYCDWFERLHGLPAVTLRYGNVYGPRQDPLGEAGVIAIFCGRLRAGRRPTVYGDGLQTRDYVHVDDVVAANLVAADSAAGGEINIGTGHPASVLDIVAALRAADPTAAASFEPEFAAARIGEVQRSCLDITRARERLGWEPRVPLVEGLRATLAVT